MSLLSKKTLAKALHKREKTDTALSFKLEDHLFPQQLSFVLDAAPAKIAVCSRRAGKTIACAADLIHTAINAPNIVCLYITLNRATAKRIVWKELKKINKQYKLGGIENISELSITFPNESIVYLSGAKDAAEVEKFRGMALKKIYIDECQSFRSHIEDLVNESLGPTLMDYSGIICLIGTPSAIPTGYFYDCWVEKKNAWSKHFWTFWDNPFLEKTSGKTHQELLDRELKRRGVSSTHTSIRREFFGEWTQDDDSLLLHYIKEKNDYDKLPDKKYNYVMGIDLGFDDADAIAILAWSEHDPTTYLVEEKVVAQQGLTELVEQVQALQKKYDVSKIVIDQGGLGKKLAEEMRRRHAIPVEAADKTRKMENIAFLNDALRTGKFKAKTTSKFAEDSYLVEIDKDKSTPDKIKVSDRYHSDIIDAVLYAFKLSPAYAYQEAPKKHPWGTPQWAKEQEDSMFEAEMEGLKAQEEYFNRINGEDY